MSYAVVFYCFKDLKFGVCWFCWKLKVGDYVAKFELWWWYLMLILAVACLNSSPCLKNCWLSSYRKFRIFIFATFKTLKTLPTLFLNEIDEHAVSLLIGISGNPGYQALFSTCKRLTVCFLLGCRTVAK